MIDYRKEYKKTYLKYVASLGINLILGGITILVIYFLK